MDIVAGHRRGLIEKMKEESAALAGRPRDFAQRAVVLHHLYDHSRGCHLWALAEARQQLRIARAIAELQRRSSRWWWTPASRSKARSALEKLAAVIGAASRSRCETAFFSYRLSGSNFTQGDPHIADQLVEVLARCHAARRSGENFPNEDRHMLFDLCRELADASVDNAAIAQAWAEIDLTRLRGIAGRLLSAKACQRAQARDRRIGWRKLERALRNDRALPAAFRSNPAQHFYALQNALAERRRQNWREACDRDPGSFELAA